MIQMPRGKEVKTMCIIVVYLAEATITITRTESGEVTVEIEPPPEQGGSNPAPFSKAIIAYTQLAPMSFGGRARRKRRRGCAHKRQPRRAGRRQKRWQRSGSAGGRQG